MEIIVSGYTDVGNCRETNQDSVLVKVFDTPAGKIGFGIMCDGMGGLSEGEKASQTIVWAFNNWAEERLKEITREPLSRNVLLEEWVEVIRIHDQNIKEYGAQKGIRLGTTAVVMLITETEYYVLNIGDSRAYEITDVACQITKDQTLVQREVDLGNITPEQALTDTRRNIILQCIGASARIVPDFFVRPTPAKATFLLCSDGFYHFLDNPMLKERFNPDRFKDAQSMEPAMADAVEYVKECGETDNITVALIKIENDVTLTCSYACGDNNSVTTELL